MKIKIVSRWNSETVLFETDADSLGAAILAALAVRATVGHQDLLSVCAAASGMSCAWSGGGTPSLEPGQTTDHLGDDGIFGALGTAVVLARDGASLSDQLGLRLSFGGMVCAMGSGASEAGSR